MQMLINATQIDDWFVSTRRDAQELLPELVRRLVRETVRPENLRKIRIPVGDQIGRPGYDGQVQITEPHLYVPEGISVWEMGTGDPEDKADEEYGKRTEDPKGVEPEKSAFVFVTPHRWDGKDDWGKEKQREGPWKQVSVLDNVDLETWLRSAPVTSRWLAREIGVPVEGLRDLEAFKKEELDAKYGLELPAPLLVGGRSEAASALRDWFVSDHTEIRLRGESEEEGAAFVVGVVNSLKEYERDEIAECLLFVEKPEVLDYLSSLSRTHCVVALTPEVRRRATALEAARVRLIVPETRTAGSGSTDRHLVNLGPVRRQACEKALTELGLSSHRISRIGKEYKGSLTALLWMISEEEGGPPPWAQGEAALELVPLLLAGKWSTHREADRKIVERLSGRPYDQVKRTLAQWEAPSRPLLCRAERWDWLAWDYAWTCLAPFIDRDHMDRFRTAVEEVLGTADPALELPPEDRWAASMHDKEHPFSPALRSGLAGSIVQLALHGTELRGIDGEIAAERLVRDLLDGQRHPRKTAWLSVARWLPDMAEAAPDSFLGAMDPFLDDKEAVNAIFEEGGMFGSSPHTYLLWALERLAWSEDYLTRVTCILGELSALDPGGRMANRPANTLSEIFLPWHPQTTAGATHRLAAIDKLYEQNPDVAWELIVSLLPGEKHSAMGTAEPQWRFWKTAETELKVTVREYWEFIESLVERMMSWAEEEDSRLPDLLPAYESLRQRHPGLADRIIDYLENLDPKELDEEEKRDFSNTLREILAHHRQVPDADWAMAHDELERLDALYRSFQPQKLFERHGWLFKSWPELPDHREEDYQTRVKRVREKRQKVVKEIYDKGGLQELLSFAKKVERPDAVGFGLAQLDLDEETESEMLSLTLDREPGPKTVPAELLLGIGYVGGTFRNKGDAWANESVDPAEWSGNKVANFALGLPTEGPTWDRLAEWSEEAESLYWQRVNARFIDDMERDAERAVSHLLEARRPYLAISVMGGCVHKAEREETSKEAFPVSTRLIVKALEEAPQHDPREERHTPGMTMIAYHVERLLDLLEGEGVELSQIASLEWKWMAALEQGKRGLKALQRTLSADPSLFVRFLKLVFRADDEADDEESTEVSEQRKAVARQAFRLLETWKRVPGTVEERPSEKAFEGDIPFCKGQVEEDTLFRWVEKARELADECGRLRVCDSHIGKILAHAPVGGDGVWPCEPVRRLIEQQKNEKIERSLEIGVYNKGLLQNLFQAAFLLAIF